MQQSNNTGDARFHCVADELRWGQTKLGPATALYVDPHEFSTLTLDDGVIHTTLPYRVDLVFVSGESVVVGEMKRPDDFIDSMYKRRLARQLRTVRDVSDVGIVVLREFAQLYSVATLRESWPQVVRELISIQMCGLTIVPARTTDREILEDLLEYSPVLSLTDAAHRRALAGTDKPSSVKGTLLNAVPGLGYARIHKLLVRFGNARGVFAASDAELKDAGIPTNVRTALQKSLDVGVSSVESIDLKT